MIVKNRFTGEEIGRFEIRSGADLRSADLYGANLSGANLRSADLYGADLRSADLYSANLRSANLSSADLYSADLYSANLSGANLSGADLSGANLYSANLSSADLRSANLSVNGNDYKVVSVIQIGPIGSRNDYSVIYFCDTAIIVNAGCFWGSLDQFADAVQKTHSDNPYGKQYRAMFYFIKSLAEAQA